MGCLMSPNHIVGLSGGKDSVAMALRLAEVEPREYKYICTPTGNEPDEMIVHWERLEQILNCKIIRVNSLTLESVMQRENILPSHKMRWCTRRLKIEPTIAYVAANSPAIMYVGLRADEEDREGIYSDKVKSDYPLRRWGWGIDDVLDYLHKKKITIPVDTNCEWCYDKRLSQWRRLWRDNPESYAKAIAYEQATGHTFRSASRDTQPAGLVQLGQKFAAGYIPRGDTDQLALFDAPETRKCRVCTL